MNTPNKPESLLVCINNRFDSGRPSCAFRGSLEILEALKQGIAQRKIDIKIEEICCLGHCSEGPTLRLAPRGKFFHETNLDMVPDILDELARRCGTR